MTQLLEAGVALRQIQVHLGLGPTKLTKIYTHTVINTFESIKNQLD
jgi:integrase/recombinase XerD